MACAALAGCTVSGSVGPVRTSPTAATSSPSPSPTSAGPSPTPSPTPTPTLDPAVACARRTDARLTADQRVGQLIMVGLPAGTAASTLDDRIATDHLGGVFLLGTWWGRATVHRAATHLQGRATRAATGGIPLLVAADQEGGSVQHLRGTGFTSIPSALAQGRLAPEDLRFRSRTWGRELASAGVTVDLAPVAATVPASLGRRNGPIGRFDREFGHDPGTVGTHVVAVVHGMREGGVEPTLKHFPGLGRVSKNTDTSSRGITDPVTGPHDPYLTPFADGIGAGARLVMVSLARYPRIDADNPAAFSSTIITGLLRGSLGYRGVVMSDDLDAKAVSSVAVGRRATRFLAAGGDVVLVSRAAEANRMTAAVRSRMGTDHTFRDTVRAAVLRVLTLKARMGLLSCSPRGGN